MPSTSDSFPPAARGIIPAAQVEEGDHVTGWNLAVQQLLDQGFTARDVDNTYQVTFTLSATVERVNPGRITEYIATGI